MAPKTMFQPRSFPSTVATPSFAVMIDRDHTALSTLVLSALDPTHDPTNRTQLVSTILWRLIRHDVSEDLVMRPAFVRYMGDEGAKEAEQDRSDHAKLKRRLLELLERLWTEDQNGSQADQSWLIEQLRPLGRVLREHMHHESGLWIPKLVAAIGEDISSELGRAYARTLVLTPDTRVVDSRNGGSENRFFRDLMEYVHTDTKRFSTLLEELEDRAARQLDGGYLDRKMEEEMKQLGFGPSTQSPEAEYEYEEERAKGKL